MIRYLAQSAKNLNVALKDSVHPTTLCGEIELDAPKGLVFAASDTHHLVAQYGPMEPKREAIADLVDRLSGGLAQCDDHEDGCCEICDEQLNTVG